MEDDGNINVDITKIKSFFLNKKVQTIFVVLLLILTLYIGISIRTSGMSNLIDKTTGDYTPLALDPYYFLRVSETMVENGGVLPEIDPLRSPHLKISWTKELTPKSTVFLYQLIKQIDPNLTLNYAAVINPVVFFALGLITFFLLLWVLTKNKWLSLVASGILTIIPPYLYRTLAGFADHESIGMFGFFLTLLFFSLGLFYIKDKKNGRIASIIFGLISGFMISFSLLAWSGAAKFLFMVLPFAFLIFWLTNNKEEIGSNSLFFYISWLVGTLLGANLFGYSISKLIKGIMLNPIGILTLFILGFISIEYLLIKKLKDKKLLHKYGNLISFGGTILLGIILYQIFIGNVLEFIFSLMERLVNPFGEQRVGLTVAESRQPYLKDFISQIGNFIFYSFSLGSLIVGWKISTGIKLKKYRLTFFFSYLIFFLGLLFTRISSSSILNGENFISKLFFFLSFLILTLVSIYIYTKSEWKIDTKWIIIVAWMIPMILSVRSAIRVFFAIVPFISFMVALALFELKNFAVKSKEEITKLVSYSLLILLIIGLIYTTLGSGGFYNSVKVQAKNQQPSYNADWQKAMDWVRTNTSEKSLFIHWWDYGYWVQTGGKRATFSDGGRSQTSYGDHLFGRYVLTTPYPETAKSFMKTFNASYLLIDPSDIGKYGAYSSIGDDKDNSDRASWLPSLIVDPSQTRENRNGTTKLYKGGFYLDSDVVYKSGNKNIFLPKGKAALAGVLIEKKKGGYSQPQGIFIYNNKQYNIPLRYIATEGTRFDFKEGLNSTAYIYPSVVNQKFESDGALIYLSEKTMNSLVAKLYLMDDPDNEYPELVLDHTEGSYPFNFYYRGFHGPIKIWKINTNEMDNILIRPEFYKTSGAYGSMDDLQFSK